MVGGANHLRIVCIICAVLWLGMGTAHAQVEAFARFDSSLEDPLIGQPFDLFLVVSVPPEHDVILPTFDADWTWQFTIFDIGDSSVEQEDGTQIYTFPMRVATWNVDTVTTPETLVTVIDPAGAENTILVEPARLFVQSTLDADMELRLSRAVAYMGYPLVIVVSVTLVVLSGVGVGAYVLYQRYANRDLRRLTANLAPKTIAQRAVNDLNRIRSESPDIITQYEAMGDRLRVYIHDLFGFSTEEQTTAELITYLRSSDLLSNNRQKELRFLLEQADLAKFAPAEIYTPQELSMLQLAIQWVQNVEGEVAKP